MLNKLLKTEIDEMDVFIFATTEEEKEKFKVENLSQADWCLRKVKASEAQIKEYEELAKAEKERIDNWLKQQKESIESGKSFMEGLLATYLYEQRKIDAKFKINTPNGKVSTRKTKSWTYDDEKVLAYLKENEQQQFIKTTETVKKADLKKVVTIVENNVVDTNGQVISGIEVVENESVTIKTT